MACMDDAKMPPPPTIRLQIWYDSTLGQHPANDDLVNFLQDYEMALWDIEVPQVLTESRWGDALVPLEADFKFRTTSRCNLAAAAAQLGRFFTEFVETYVDDLFDSTAIIANMYPVGEAVSRETKATFPLAKLLRSLAMQSHVRAQSYPSLNHNLTVETLSLAMEMPSRAVEFEKMLATGDFTPLNDSIPSKPSSFHEDTASEEALEAWNRSLLQLEHVHRFSKSLKSCIDGLSSEGVSVGALWGNLVQIQKTILHFSAYHENSYTFMQDLISRYEAQAQRYLPMKTVFGAAVSIILGNTITNLYGFGGFMTTATASSVIFPGVAYLAEFFFGKRKNADRFIDAVSNFDMALRKAQFSLAIILSDQVCQMPYPLLPQDKGRKLIESLGVDFAHLKDEEYSYKSALKGLTDLLRSYEELDKLRDSIRKDAGLKEFLQAKMASANPDGGEPMDCRQD